MSRCLLGERVRYDGETKSYPQLIDFINHNFEAISVCPEVEIGLSVPRPAVQLRHHCGKITLRGRDDSSIDITTSMHEYCLQRPPQLQDIQGYIFKSKSPSCGINDIPIFNDQAEIIDHDRGFFVNAMLQHYPELPITDEQGLLDELDYRLFLQQVIAYQH